MEPTDVDSTHPGLPADVRLTAFSQVTQPIRSGKVGRVSAHRLVPGLPALADLNPQPSIPAEVTIVAGERTALEYLIEPIVLSFGRALRED